ncbi:MAG: hypothetical protein R6V67_11375 [Spirochaetia bacterium]
MPDNSRSSSKARLISFLHDREDAMDTYIEVLELLYKDIEAEDMDKFAEHTQLEDDLIKRLEALQRVIPPLRRSLNPKEKDGEEIELLEGRFSEKCKRALDKNRENRQRIGKELSSLEEQIARSRRFSARTGASYVGTSQRNGTPQYIDIEQ